MVVKCVGSDDKESLGTIAKKVPGEFPGDKVIIGNRWIFLLQGKGSRCVHTHLTDIGRDTLHKNKQAHGESKFVFMLKETQMGKSS